MTIKSLQDRIKYQFRDDHLFRMALTHASAGSDSNDHNYERLEFLGDRVLGLVIADIIYKRYPQEAEGDLAKRHAALVQGKTLALVAKKIDLGAAIILSESERIAGGDENDNILADVMEALLGAVYLDSGLTACSDMIATLWDDLLDVMIEPPQDPKTALQEWAQARGFPLPEYEQVDRTGPDHAPEFTIQVRVGQYDAAHAIAGSRRAAEKGAATRLLEYLQTVKE